MSNGRHSGPPRTERGGLVKKDILASLVVFLVALPLCMGIAGACGMPVVAGIITGVIGGLIVGSLAGCPLQVSGPAAGLILVVKEIVSEPDGVHLLGLCLFLAGAIQVAAGLLKLGQWFRAVSPAVIEGMLAGIGVVIIATQFQFLVDGRPPEPAPAVADETSSFLDEESESDVEGNRPEQQKHGVVHKVLDIPGHVLDAVLPAPDSPNTPWALVVGAVSIAILILWRPLVPKALKLIPAAFVAVLVAVGIALVLPAPIRTIPPVTDFAGAMQQALVWPSPGQLWTMLLDWKVLKYTLTLAFVASAETLLCAGAVDQMVKDGPRTKYDKELWAQGVGNMLCGLLHALPMTGVIVRSKANIEAGARSRLSAILHGLWLLVFISAVPFALQVIPIAALAGILVFTGFRLIDLQAIKALRKIGWSEVGIYVATLVSVVLFGLLEGVLIGSALAMAKLLYTFSHLAIRLEEDPKHKRTILHLEGAATFIRLPQLAGALDTVPPNTELHVQMERLSYIDHACLELLISWEKQHEATGGSLVMDWESLHAKFRTPAQNGQIGETAPNGNGEPAGKGESPSYEQTA